MQLSPRSRAINGVSAFVIEPAWSLHASGLQFVSGPAPRPHRPTQTGDAPVPEAPGDTLASRGPTSPAATTDDGTAAPENCDLPADPSARSEPHLSMGRVPWKGTVLGGKYRIERVLGAGGMGIVAAAHHLQLDQRVAIKYLIPEALEYPELVERFMREARAAARLRGEHVVRVIDVGHFEGQVPFIVLEYLEGESLAQRLAARGPLPIVEAARYVLEVCEGLAEAHAAKVVHRDIKPANIFIATQPDRRRIVKVLDFGISKLLDEPLTPTLSTLGTTLYMSPEQLRSAKQVDHRTDIWSLGVVFYELLTGVPAFHGWNLIDVAANVESNKPTSLSTLRPEVSESLTAVIARCMRTDPDERYATLLELATDLAPLANPSDRESVRTISSVLYGSIAPPPRPVSLVVNSRPTVPAAIVPEATPQQAAADDHAPESLPSDAPVTKGGDPGESAPSVSSRDGSRPSPRRFGALSLAGAATLALIAGIAWERSSPSRPPPSHASPPAAETAASTNTPITLRLSASPPHSRVRIDDGTLGPVPLVATVLPDDRDHRVHLEADGYVSKTELVRFTSDLTMTIALTPARAPGEPSAPP